MDIPATQRPHGGLSLVRGSQTPDLFQLTFGQLVDQQAARYGSKDAVMVGWTNTRLSFQDVSLRTKELARGLLAMGVNKGDRIAILSGDDERIIELFFAGGRIGAVLVILNKTYTPNEYPSILFIADVVNRRSALPILDQLQTLQRSLRQVVLVRWDAVPIRSEITWDQASVNINSVVNFQFTSGTTGSPKATMLSHFNVINNGFMIGEYLQLTHEDVLCCAPPLFHCFGLVAGLMATFTHGAAIGFAGRDFDPAQVVDLLVRERCTALHGVPTMYIAILKHLDNIGVTIDTIRTGIAAGTKIPPALITEIQERLGYQFVGNTYGMTETSPASFMTSVSDTLDQQLYTVGRVMPHVTAKVVDQENRILPIDKAAEVMIRDENGVLWMHTGDEATIDEHGYCRMTGRIKDIIIRGCENIYPLEIEEHILSHPTISNVSVVGLKDERYGEAVAAFLQIRPGHEKPSHEAMRAWVHDELGRHKAPQHTFWLGPGEVITEYPVTGSGKIRKEILREIGNRILEQSEAKPMAKL
ncbi:hypothetical protein CEP54_011001 [Fusarium duplospermum]|uniref:Uncharacterized protein n=1 Tax=Fusarium duplospermum TaxID=1325734 RepID=A0A428PGQ8_9HYPO|nr:hypothetical protein CEP54_011001 [Fusarium duplospermum]